MHEQSNPSNPSIFDKLNEHRVALAAVTAVGVIAIGAYFLNGHPEQKTAVHDQVTTIEDQGVTMAVQPQTAEVANSLNEDYAHYEGNYPITPSDLKLRRIAFVSNRSGNYEIYLEDTLTKHITNLTNNPGADMGESLSPDHKSLVFHSDRDGKNN